MAVCSDEVTRAEQDPASAQSVMVSCHCKEVTPCKLPKSSTCACLLLQPRKCWIQLCGKQLSPLLHSDLPSRMCASPEWTHRSELSPSSCSVTYSKRLRHKDLNSDPLFVPRQLMTSQGWGGSTPYLLPQGARLRRLVWHHVDVHPFLSQEPCSTCITHPAAMEVIGRVKYNLRWTRLPQSGCP